MGRPLTSGERALLAAIEATAREDGWCDRSIDCLCDVMGARSGRRPHRSTVYRQLERLREDGRLATERRRIFGRWRTCHRTLLRGEDDVPALLRRIATLEARLAEVEGRAAEAANGEAEQLVAHVAAAEVHVAELADGPVVVAEEDIPRVRAAGIQIRRRSAWPRGAARPYGPPGLAAVREALREGEDAESLGWLVTWYHAATLDAPEQRSWWGAHLFRPGVRARARALAGVAERRHRERLAAALRGAQVVPLVEVDAEERARAAAVFGAL